MTVEKEKTLITDIRSLGILPKAKDACLVMLYGPDLGKRYTIGDEPIIIGRSEESTIFVDKDSISRKHAQIIVENSHYKVSDLGSTNGTYINDKPIKKVQLQDGDIIKIGEVIFKFLSRDNLENIYHEETYRLATTDGLTTVYNKRYFLDCIDREFSRSMRHNRTLCMAIFDLDFFKKLNDTYGHLAGDYALKKTAQIIQKHIRFEDVFARYGGEEFTLLLPETERWQALQIVEKLRRYVEEQDIIFDNMHIQVTVSIGLAVSYAGLESSNKLFDLADKNLYVAKESGRNQVYG